MKLGIKVGPTDWEEKLKKAKYDAVEIYFNLHLHPQYLPLFKYLKKQQILTGLHFWGILKNGCFPNFATDDPSISQESLLLIKKTIDIADYWKFDYVLTHPFSCDFWQVNSQKIFKVLPVKISWKKGLAIMKNNMNFLADYAQKKGIKFVLEQTVRNEPIHYQENNNGEAIKVRTISALEIKEFSKNNLKLCLDFAHLATWHGPAKREIVLEKLEKDLLKLKKCAYIIHTASVKPPYITSAHNGFTPEEEKLETLPNAKETISLLRLFKNTNCLVIPEPQKKDHLWHNEFLNNSGLFE